MASDKAQRRLNQRVKVLREAGVKVPAQVTHREIDLIEREHRDKLASA